MAIDFVPGIDIAASGLSAERTRMNVATNNMANANSTMGPDGKVYQRKEVIMSPLQDSTFGSEMASLKGVKVQQIIESDRSPEMEHAPGHPQADQQGMIKKANISPLEEMLDMMTAMRAYEANLKAMKHSSEMAKRTIDLAK